MSVGRKNFKFFCSPRATKKTRESGNTGWKLGSTWFWRIQEFEMFFKKIKMNANKKQKCGSSSTYQGSSLFSVYKGYIQIHITTTQHNYNMTTNDIIQHIAMCSIQIIKKHIRLFLVCSTMLWLLQWLDFYQT